MRVVRRNGFTLIELLVSITIGGIIAGVIILILDIGIMSWRIGEADILIQGVGQRILDEIIGGSFEFPGIRGCVEIVSAGSSCISFVPLWIDEHEIRKDLDKGAVFCLKKKLFPGSSIPLAKIKSQDDEEFHSIRVSLIEGDKDDTGSSVKVDSALKRGSKLRIIYHPDSSGDSGVAVSYLWDGVRQVLVRNYYGDVREIPARDRGVRVSEIKFLYFDSGNSRILSSSDFSRNELQSIIAVKVILSAVKGDEIRELSSFVNIRNVSNRGRGVPVAEGSTLQIPDSEDIECLILTNIGGVENGDVIELEARPSKGNIWKISVKFGLMPEESGEEEPKLLSLSVEYPPGRAVWSRFLNQPVEHGLNLANFGNSLYDYDIDGKRDVVNLDGEVELTVTRMDVDSAAIAVQP